MAALGKDGGLQVANSQSRSLQQSHTVRSGSNMEHYPCELKQPTRSFRIWVQFLQSVQNRVKRCKVCTSAKVQSLTRAIR
jgi:hypothetical protein